MDPFHVSYLANSTDSSEVGYAACLSQSNEKADTRTTVGVRYQRLYRYDSDIVARLHDGNDDLQAIPVDYDTYRKLGVASFHLARAMKDPRHHLWGDNSSEGCVETPGVWKVGHSICGTDKFDIIVCDPILEDIHSALAGSTIFISASYYIEKIDPAPSNGLHNGEFPPDRPIHYSYDQANRKFNYYSTNSVVILSDMT